MFADPGSSTAATTVVSQSAPSGSRRVPNGRKLILHMPEASIACNTDEMREPGTASRGRPAEPARARRTDIHSPTPTGRASLHDLQQLVGNRAVVQLLHGTTSPTPLLVSPPPVQRASKTAEVRSAITRDDFSDTLTPPLIAGGAYFHLQGLSAADLAGTIDGLRPNERELLRVGGHGPRVGAARLRPRDATALRAISATGRLATAQRAVELVDALTAGVDYAPALTGIDRSEMFRVLTQLPAAQLEKLVRQHAAAASVYGPPTGLTHTLGLVLADVTGAAGATGHTARANDVIDLGSVRGSLNKRCATIYNEMGQFIASEARRLGLSSAAIAALMIVESGGQAFGSTDRPIARFENHVFDREWGHAHAAVFRQHFRYTSWVGSTHRFRELPTDPWQACHRNQSVEWQCIELAERLAGREPALRSGSFGAGQIMGFNHTRVGFATAAAMVDAFTASLRAQVTAILSFIAASATLLAHAAAGRWLPIASAYNGSGQAPAYAAKIASYHAAYDTLTRGMEHHVP